DLLAVEHPAAVDGVGARLHRGEVGPGSRLAEQLAPDLVGAQDPREPAFLLLPRSVGEESWPGEVDADAADELGGARPRQPLLNDVVLERSRAASAVLRRPRHADPPALG